VGVHHQHVEREALDQVAETLVQQLDVIAGAQHLGDLVTSMLAGTSHNDPFGSPTTAETSWATSKTDDPPYR
jgi:hypothetical protein